MREGRRWRVTRLGWFVIGMLVASALLVTFAGGPVRFVALVVGAVVLLLLFGEGLSGPGDRIGGYGRKDEVIPRERFGDRQ